MTNTKCLKRLARNARNTEAQMHSLYKNDTSRKTRTQNTDCVLLVKDFASTNANRNNNVEEKKACREKYLSSLSQRQNWLYYIFGWNTLQQTFWSLWWWVSTKSFRNNYAICLKSEKTSYRSQIHGTTAQTMKKSFYTRSEYLVIIMAEYVL